MARAMDPDDDSSSCVPRAGPAYAVYVPLHLTTSTPCALARLPAVSQQGYAFMTFPSSTAAISVLTSIFKSTWFDYAADQ